MYYRFILILLAVTILGCNESNKSDKDAYVDSSSHYTVVDGKLFQGGKPFTGELVKHYKNGSLKYKISYLNGQRNGSFQEFYENQAPLRTGHFRRDKRDSIWTRYYANGNLESVVGYKGDSMNGACTSYYENGKLETKGEYRRGKQHGRWDFYDSVGRWVNGGEFEHGKPIFRITEDPTQDKEINARGIYPNGQLKALSPRKEGKPHGDWIGYYENGQVRRKVHFENGVAQGKVEYFYENGSMKSFHHRVDGKRDGESKTYYENGKLASEGQYINGVKDGIWLTYSIDGQVSKREKYADGKVIKEK